MRALTAAQQRALESADRATHVRVRIDPGSGFIDLSDYLGFNWIESVTWGGGPDAPVQTAKVGLYRSAESLSLVPFIDGSKANQGGALVDIANPIIIEVAVVGGDAQPGSGDWVEVHRGEIDEIDWASSPMSISTRDQGGRLVDTFIEVQRVYGSDPTGDLIEDVIQDILDDNFGVSVIDLYSPNGTGGTPFNPADSTGFRIRQYVQSKQNVMEAIRTLALLIGYDIKYRWQTNTSAFQLVMDAPVRQVRARGTLTLTGQPIAAETFTINATAITAVAGAPAADQFQIGATVSDTVDNIVAAVNAGTEGTNVIAWRETGVNAVVFEWRTPGTAGNSIVFTEALTNATADGGGTLGGTLAGADAQTTPDFTFGASRYFDPQRLVVSRQDIRNASAITFLNPSDSNNLVTVVREDPASIAKYGRRYAAMTLASTGEQIDTIAEASTLAQAMLNDLSEPDAEFGVPVPLFWPVEDGDLYRFTANPELFDSDQDLAIVKFEHRIAMDRSRTMLTVRGKPTGGVKRWLRVEGNNIVAPAVDNRADNVPTSVVLSSSVGAVTIRFDDPRTMNPPILDWKTSRVHGVVDTAPGYPDFTPTVSNSLAEGRQTEFVISDLVPGRTYSFKVLHVDEQGNVGAISTFVQQATQTVAPYHTNPDGQHDQLIPNPDLNMYTLGDAFPPDGWEEVGAGSWGSGLGVYFSATSQTGNRSVEMLVQSGADRAIRTRLVPFSEGDLIQVGALLKQGATTTAEANTDILLRVYFYESDGTTVISSPFTAVTIGTTWEERVSAAFVAPALTRFVRVQLQGRYTSADYDLLIDRIGAVRGSAILARQSDATGTSYSAANTPVTVTFVTASPEEIGVSYSAGVWTILQPGPYQFTVQIFSSIDTFSFTHNVTGYIQVDQGSGFTTIATARALSGPLGGSGNYGFLQLTSKIVDLEVGDQVRFQAEADTLGAGGGFDGVSGVNTKFSGRMVQRTTR